MQLSDLIGKLNVAKVVGNDCIEITSVEADSRRVAEGSLFVAVRGVSVDGHTFIAKAEAQGASAVVCEELPDELSPRVTYVVTPESREALGLLASAWYGEPSRQLTLVGVTGLFIWLLLKNFLHQLAELIPILPKLKKCLSTFFSYNIIFPARPLRGRSAFYCNLSLLLQPQQQRIKRAFTQVRKPDLF